MVHKRSGLHHERSGSDHERSTTEHERSGTVHKRSRAHHKRSATVNERSSVYHKRPAAALKGSSHTLHINIFQSIHRKFNHHTVLWFHIVFSNERFYSVQSMV